MWRRLMAGMMSLLLLGVVTQQLEAHAELVTATPAPGDTVQTVPSVLTLEFSEPVQQPTLLLISEASTEELNVTITADETTIRADMPSSLPNGTYQVVWNIVSEDEHNLSGSYSFSIAVAEENTVELPLPLIAGAVGLGVLSIGVAFWVWRRFS